MRILKNILGYLMMAFTVITGSIWSYIVRNRLVKIVAIFGGLLVTVATVWAIAPPELKPHINAREILHVGFGFTLYCLFMTMLILHIQGWVNKRHVVHSRFPWYVGYFAPLAFLLAINATNEWGIAMTGKPDMWPDLLSLTWRGDWFRAIEAARYLGGMDSSALIHVKGVEDPVSVGYLVEYWTAVKFKSIADLAAWAFGALAAAWFCYRLPEPLWHLRQDYLRHKDPNA